MPASSGQEPEGARTSRADSETTQYGEQARVDWRVARSQAAIAGIFVVVLMLFPAPVPLFALWMLAGGFLAVYLYRRKLSPVRLSWGAGARMGAFAGAIGSAISLVITAIGFSIQHFVLHQRTEVIAELQRQLEQAIAANPNPEARQMMQGWLANEGFASFLVVSFIVGVLLWLILSSLGGLAGAALFGRRDSSR